MPTSPTIFSLTGQTALVTGASGWLGQAMSESLAEAGAHVLLNGRRREELELLCDKMRHSNLSAEVAHFDVTDNRAVRSFFENYSSKCISIIVNNAYGGAAGTIKSSDEAPYRDSYDLTVVAAHRILTAALPSLRKGRDEYGNASVINIASMYGIVSPDLRVYSGPEASNPPFYGAAKAGLLQWTKYAACEFGPESIRVNAISPGPFPSDYAKKNNPGLVDSLVSRVPLARLGDPDEMKGPILFLASRASSFVNGANLVVDGGWTVW